MSQCATLSYAVQGGFRLQGVELAELDGNVALVGEPGYHPHLGGCVDLCVWCPRDAVDRLLEIARLGAVLSVGAQQFGGTLCLKFGWAQCMPCGWGLALISSMRCWLSVPRSFSPRLTVIVWLGLRENLATRLKPSLEAQ